MSVNNSVFVNMYFHSPWSRENIPRYTQQLTSNNNPTNPTTLTRTLTLNNSRDVVLPELLLLRLSSLTLPLPVCQCCTCLNSLSF